MDQKLTSLLAALRDTPPGELGPFRAFLDFFQQAHVEGKDISTLFRDFTTAVKTEEALRLNLQALLQHLLDQYHFFSFFTQHSHLDQRSFIGGVWARLKHKVVPQIAPETDIQYFFRQIFTTGRELNWMQEVPAATLEALFGASGLVLSPEALQRELSLAIQSLGAKVSAFGLDYRLRALFLRLELSIQPFVQLQAILAGALTEADLPQALTVLKAVRANVNSLRLRKAKIGTTLELTYRGQQTLDKLQLLEGLLQLKMHDTDAGHWLRVLRNSLAHEFARRRLGKFINSHFDLLALEIVEHTASSGEKYIADNPAEYLSMFRASMLGGLLIAFFAAGKILLYDLHLAKLPEGLVYGLNYATCFVLVKILGGIIATKQPAMTASTIVKAIDKENDLQLGKLEDIVQLIKRASSSQLLSFAGNLVIAFPLAIGLAWGYGAVTDTALVTVEKGEKLLKDLWPVAGGALLYAAIAGVFLALSGLISGYVDNKVLASNLPQRLREHPLLRRIFPHDFRANATNYLCRYLGALSGNISLGFFLGMAGYLGYLTGLPIDIRHIAFSSANLGFAWHALGFGAITLLLGGVSVLLIGLLNFSVSFGITLYLTLKSRSISFAEIFRLLGRLGREAVLRPWTFLWPAKGRADTPVHDLT